MAIYAVGDIQGCFKPLKQLLKKVEFNPEKDQLWCVGDLVNRGPDSLAVLRYLKTLGDACTCVLGNHDLYLLSVVAAGDSSGNASLQPVLDAEDCDELIDWLPHRPLLHVDTTREWCMVHAGLHPDWSLKEAVQRARGIEKALRGKHWQEFCAHLHHVKFPISQPGKKDPTRPLFDAAVMTRTRYCTQDGLFNWNVRTGESSNLKDRPWYAHKTLRWRRDCNIVFGHWAAKGLIDHQPHVLGLDSGCVWGGAMTMAKIRKERRFRIVANVRCQSCQKPAGKSKSASKGA